MRSTLLTKSKMVINLSADGQTLQDIQPSVDRFLSSLPEGDEAAVSSLESWKADMPSFAASNEGFVVPTQVNYVGKGGRVYQPGERASGATSVVARSLRTGYLWDNVRVIGGAYGGFCRFSPLTGTFSYLSYRDPNLLGTIENYDGAADFLTTLDITDEALAQAIIGTVLATAHARPRPRTLNPRSTHAQPCSPKPIHDDPPCPYSRLSMPVHDRLRLPSGTVGDLDSPMGPDQKGFEAMRRWLVGETAEQRQRWRAEVLATTKEDFKEVRKQLPSLRAHPSAATAFAAVHVPSVRVVPRLHPPPPPPIPSTHPPKHFHPPTTTKPDGPVRKAPRYDDR